MNQAEAKLANQSKGRLVKELRLILGVKEFEKRHVGDYKGHIHKIKGLFHSNKTGIRNYDQVDKNLQFLMNKSK